MNSSSPVPVPLPRRRLLWEGKLARTTLTLLVAGASNVLVARMAATAFGVPARFMALQPGPVLLFTSVGVLGAAGVWELINRSSSTPVRWFQRIAAVALLLSLIPDLLLFRSSPLDGTTPGGIVTLMLLHVVACAVCVTLLPKRPSHPA